MLNRNRPYSRLKVMERGSSASEFAIVLPSFLLMVMIVFALAIWAFGILLAGTGVPAGARQAGISDSAGTGLAVTRSILDVLPSVGSDSGAANVSMGAPGCQRAAYARLNAASSVRLPLLGEFNIHMRAGSQSRQWRFWPGYPTDGCE